MAPRTGHPTCLPSLCYGPKEEGTTKFASRNSCHMLPPCRRDLLSSDVTRIFDGFLTTLVPTQALEPQQTAKRPGADPPPPALALSTDPHHRPGAWSTLASRSAGLDWMEKTAGCSFVSWVQHGSIRDLDAVESLNVPNCLALPSPARVSSPSGPPDSSRPSQAPNPQNL